MLLVEDEQLVGNTHEILRRNGYLVLEAADGVEPCAPARLPGRIDLLLRRGHAAHERHELVELARPSAPNEILYVSGYSEAIARGELTDGIDLLAKPFTPAC